MDFEGGKKKKKQGEGNAPQSNEGANLFDRNPNLNSNPTSPKSTLHVRQQAQATTSHWPELQSQRFNEALELLRFLICVVLGANRASTWQQTLGVRILSQSRNTAVSLLKALASTRWKRLDLKRAKECQAWTTWTRESDESFTFPPFSNFFPIFHVVFQLMCFQYL